MGHINAITAASAAAADDALCLNVNT